MAFNRIISLIMVLTTINAYGYSFDYHIVGTLLDRQSQQPIAFATVAVYHEVDSSFVTGVISNSEGHFTVDMQEQGNYYVEVRILGFGKHHVSSIILDHSNPIHDLGVISLNPQALSLDEIEVVSDRSSVEYKVDRKVLNISELGVSDNTPLSEALQILPSIETDIQGNVSFRGSGNFQVLIDGKLSMLSPSQALQQYQTSQIERIEIITNPSAKHQADNTSGIIHLILKKGEGFGLSGIASLGTSIGVNHFQPYNLNSSLNFRREKYSITSSLNFTDRRLDFIYTTKQRRLEGADLDIFSMNHVPWLRSRASLDFDYFINDQHTLTLAGRIMQNDNRFNIQAENYLLDSNELPFFSQVEGFTHRHTRALTLHDRLKFNDGRRELSTLITYFNQSIDQEQYFLQYPTLILSQANTNRYFDTNSDHDQVQLTVDYTDSIGENGSFEMGLNLITLSRSSLRQEKESIPVNMPFSVVYFGMSSGTYAGYTTYQNTLWGVNFLGGLRIEHYSRKITQYNSDLSFGYKKLNFFPGIHLTKLINEKQEIKLSYTRRILRPSMSQLQPYPDWSDNVRSYGGNPNLIPSNISALELSYSAGFEKVTATLESYFRNTSNHITDGERINQETGIIEGTPVNIDNSQFYGIESLIDISAVKWLRIITSGTYFQNRITGLLFDTNIYQKYNGWRTRLSTNISLPKNSKFIVSGFYNSKVLDLQGKVASNYWVNLSFNTSVLNKQGTLSIDYQDIFGTGRSNRIRMGESFVQEINLKLPRKIISIHLSYKFNGFKSKSRRFEFED